MQYPGGAIVTVSDGSFTIDLTAQTLTYVAGDLNHHRIEIRRK
jgi:hypothetical protein